MLAKAALLQMRKGRVEDAGPSDNDILVAAQPASLYLLLQSTTLNAAVQILRLGSAQQYQNLSNPSQARLGAFHTT